MEQESKIDWDKYHKCQLEHNSSDGWYCLGLLEWTDDISNYAECSSKEDDYVWVKQEDRDEYKHPNKKWKFGIPAVKVGKVKLYWISIGPNPVVGNTLYMKSPMTVIEILKWLVCSSVIEVGRINERIITMGIPKGVRFKGMSEYILREEKLKNN